MVCNAVKSIRDLQYDSWELAFIDDGSDVDGQSIVEDILGEYLDRITFYHTHDTIEDKLRQGGSRHGEFMNMAIKNSKSDFVVILCDDDALTSWSFESLNTFFQTHPEVMYCYSHIIPFDPFSQRPGNHLPRPDHWFNRYTEPILPSCQVDSAQVAFRTRCAHVDGVRYRFPLTGALDADVFTQLADRYGLCTFTGAVTQYKGVFDDQMSNRPEERIFKPKDISHDSII